MKTNLIFYCCLVLSFFTACKQEVVLKEMPFRNSLEKGQDFCVILPEIHSDGATWQISDNYDQSLISRVKEVWHGPEKGIYFYLKAQKAGETNLHFIKRKYTDTIDTKDFNLIISKAK